RRDGRVESFGARAEPPERRDGRLGGAAYHTPPADMRRGECPRLAVVEDDREAVGREDREWRARLDAHEDVDGAGEAAARRSLRRLGAVDLLGVAHAAEVEAGRRERPDRAGAEGRKRAGGGDRLRERRDDRAVAGRGPW